MGHIPRERERMYDDVSGINAHENRWAPIEQAKSGQVDRRRAARYCPMNFPKSWPFVGRWAQPREVILQDAVPARIAERLHFAQQHRRRRNPIPSLQLSLSHRCSAGRGQACSVALDARTAAALPAQIESHRVARHIEHPGLETAGQELSLSHRDRAQI